MFCNKDGTDENVGQKPTNIDKHRQLIMMQ